MPINAVGAFRPNFRASKNQSKESPINTGVQKQHLSDKVKNNKNKTPLIIGGAAILLIAATAVLKRKSLGLSKIFMSKNKIELKAAEEKVKNLTEFYLAKAKMTVDGFTNDNYVDMTSIDRTAAAVAVSFVKYTKEPVHHAATIIEHGYKTAYSKAELKDGKNILNWIHERLSSPDSGMPIIYAKLPKIEAQARLKIFVDDLLKIDSHKGMTPEKFTKDMWEIFIPKGIEQLKHI